MKCNLTAIIEIDTIISCKMLMKIMKKKLDCFLTEGNFGKINAQFGRLS